MNLPNLISLARLLSVPLIVWMIVNGWMAGALWLFVLAGLSDAVDGFLAKRLACRTQLGVYLDPIADKALLVSIYVALGHQGHLPSWLVILVVSRDVLIIGGALLIHVFNLNPVPIAPMWIGKLNTLVQILLAVLVLAVVGYDIPDHGSRDALVWLTAATTIASGAAYLVRWSRGTRQFEKGAE